MRKISTLTIGFLLFLAFGVKAELNIQGKVTEKISSPSSNQTFNINEPFYVRWEPISTTYSTSNYELAYYMLYHAESKTILRPGKNTQYKIENFGIGSHTFKVRAVQRLNGSAKYGAYSSAVTVNIVNPVSGNKTHEITSIPSKVFHDEGLTVSWSPVSGFTGLNWDYYSLGHYNSTVSNGYSYTNTSSVSKSYSGLPLGSKQCFKVAAKYEGQFGQYSTTKCADIVYNIQGQTTHTLSVRNASEHYLR